MTKNQVNYLLALATLVVVWLYFNTFSMLAMVQRRMPAPNRAPVSAMAPGTGEEAYTPRSYGNNNRDRRALADYLAEIKRRAEAANTSGAMGTASPTGTSRVVREEMMKTVSGVEGGGPVKREFVAFSSTTPAKTGVTGTMGTKAPAPAVPEKKQ